MVNCKKITATDFLVRIYVALWKLKEGIERLNQDDIFKLLLVLLLMSNNSSCEGNIGLDTCSLNQVILIALLLEAFNPTQTDDLFLEEPFTPFTSF